MALEALVTLSLGLLIIWIVLSVAVNQVTDWISVVQLQQPRDLQEAIRGMVQDDELLQKFYEHSDIRGLVPPRKPVRFPPWMYRLPLLQGFTRERSAIPGMISNAIFADAMFDVLIRDSLSPEESDEELSLARIQTSIERLKRSKPRLSQLLGKLFPGLGKPAILDVKINEYKTNIDNWYRRSTIHLVEKQRRRKQALALFSGLMIAVLLNIDMISMVAYLWREPTVRQVLVQSASGFNLPQDQLDANPEQALRDFNLQFVGISFPIGWGINRTETSTYVDDNCQLFPAAGQTFGIPLPNRICLAPPYLTNQTNLPLKVMGFLITAITASQGARFWSDVFRGLVSRVQHEHST